MVFSLAKRLQGKGQPLEKGVHLFYSQVGRDKLSLQELNKGTLIYSPEEEQDPLGEPLSMTIILKASQRNSFQHGVRIGFRPAIMRLSFDL